MDRTQSEALENLRIVRETIDRSKSNLFWNDFVVESRKLFLLSGILVLIGAMLAQLFFVNSFPLWSHIVLWISVLAISGTYKGSIFSRMGKKNGISYWAYLKKITPREFWMIDIPMEITGLTAIVCCIVTGRFEFILPLIILGGGHVMNALGVLFKTKSYSILGYVWQLIGLGSFFIPSLSPLLLVAIAFGVVMILYGIFAGGRRG